MMKKELISSVLNKEAIEKNKATIHIVSQYSKVASIMERTNIAMGRKKRYVLQSTNPINVKLDKNIYASTH